MSATMPASAPTGGLRPRRARATRSRRSPTIARASEPSITWADAAPQEIPPLHEIERIVLDVASDLSLHEAIERAHRRALALRATARASVAAGASAAVGFAADLVVAVAPELAHRAGALQAMIDQLETTAQIPRCLLGREVLRASQLLRLPPPEAIEVQLALLLAFAQARAAALWADACDGELMMLAGAGEVDAMPAESREVAGKLITGETVSARADGELDATAIHRWQNSSAALLVFGEDVLAPGGRLLLEAAEPFLALALERRHPTADAPSVGSGTAPRDGDRVAQDAVTAAERRLTRLRFDLHDGPQQDVLMLAEDLKLFRSQLASVVSRDHDARLLGRVDDLEARLIALDGDLRRISVSVQSPFLHEKSFEDALGTLIEGFSARSGLTPAVELEGDFTALTDSQHITLLGLIREALSNVREHSHADHVTVAVSTENGAVTATVTDDGRGFNPETMLVRAARSGHLGLVGMHERVRLLGGSTRITSKPGGPTVISAVLPPAPVQAPRRSDR